MPFVNQGIPRKHIPESQACLTFSVISESACVVEWLGRKQNYLS